MAYGRGRARAGGGRPRVVRGGRRPPARHAGLRRHRPSRVLRSRFSARKIEALICRLANAERRRRGAPRLSRVRAIDGIARAHSLDMSRRGYYGHVSPEGYDATDRAAKRGRKYKTRHGLSYTIGLAENIGVGLTYRSYLAAGDKSTYRWVSGEGEIASRLVAGWMRSAGHRRNMLNSSYSRIGVGVAISREEQVYATQNFC